MKDRNKLFILYRRQSEKSAGPRVDLRLVSFFGVLLVVLGLAGWLYLRQATEVAHLANEIRQLELQKEAYHRELVVLQAEVAMLGSLKRVLNEGIEMGYILPDAADSANHLVIESPYLERAEDRLSVNLGETSRERHTASQPNLWQKVTEQLGSWLDPVIPGTP